jgi:hypothetical protein
MTFKERKALSRLGATLRLSLLALLTLSVANGVPRPALARISGALQRYADPADTGGCPGSVASKFGIRTTNRKPTAAPRASDRFPRTEVGRERRSEMFRHPWIFTGGSLSLPSTRNALDSRDARYPRVGYRGRRITRVCDGSLGP